MIHGAVALCCFAGVANDGVVVAVAAVFSLCGCGSVVSCLAAVAPVC